MSLVALYELVNPMWLSPCCVVCRPIKQLLGGEGGINNKNIMLYMGMIEHRATQLSNLLQYGQLRVRRWA